jgi:hypothetical protein
VGLYKLELKVVPNITIGSITSFASSSAHYLNQSIGNPLVECSVPDIKTESRSSISEDEEAELALNYT